MTKHFARRRYRRTTLIIIGLCAFLLGVALARRFRVDTSWVWLSWLALIALHRQNNLMLPATVICVGLVLGLWRGGEYMRYLSAYKPLILQPVTLEGRVDTDAVYANRSQLSFDLVNLHVVAPVDEQLVGKVAVKGYGPAMVYRGDLIQLEGKLYPTRGARQASVGFSDITVLKTSHSGVDNVRRKFLAGLQSALPEPMASFAAGLLIGQRSTLSPKVTNDLKSSGLTHIVAVSGYNLTIIIYAVHRLLKNRSKYQSTVISLLCIGLFLLITGFSASIVRAAIVSVLSLAVWYFGRQIRPLLLLLVAAVITVGWYPIFLWADIGWYLSFLAFFGVLIIAPIVTKRFYKTKVKPKLIDQVVAETLAAQAMALPLIMYIFSEVSLVALVANVLVVPLVPLAMLLSLIAGVAGMFMAPLAGWLSWPARFLLTYMLDVVHLFAGIPHALTSSRLSLRQLLIIYIMVIGVTTLLWHKTKRKNAIITEESYNTQ